MSLASLAPYTPVAFVSTQATDTLGNVARNQALLDLSLPAPVELSSGPGIPVITGGGPFTGSPPVTYMDRLDPGAVAAGLGFAITEITATDNGGNGRAWSLMIEDTNPAVGSTAIQFPDLSGIGVPGLATGVWSIRAEDYLYLSTTFGVGDFLPEERFRQQATYARAQSVSFVVNYGPWAAD